MTRHPEGRPRRTGSAEGTYAGSGVGQYTWLSHSQDSVKSGARKRPSRTVTRSGRFSALSLHLGYTHGVKIVEMRPQRGGVCSLERKPQQATARQERPIVSGLGVPGVCKLLLAMCYPLWRSTSKSMSKAPWLQTPKMIVLPHPSHCYRATRTCTCTSLGADRPIARRRPISR